jgi:hypothetical protein
MSAVNAWKRVKRAARLAGIRARSRFRRTSCATLTAPHALRRGADLATVRDTLGHASIARLAAIGTPGPRSPAAIILPSDEIEEAASCAALLVVVAWIATRRLRLTPCTPR